MDVQERCNQLITHVNQLNTNKVQAEKRATACEKELNKQTNLANYYKHKCEKLEKTQTSLETLVLTLETCCFKQEKKVQKLQEQLNKPEKILPDLQTSNDSKLQFENEVDSTQQRLLNSVKNLADHPVQSSSDPMPPPFHKRSSPSKSSIQSASGKKCCKVCNRLFSSRINLQIHQKTVHELRKAKEYRQKKSSLDQNKKHGYPVDNNAHVCLCGHMSKTKSQLSGHIRYYLAKEKNFKCKFCDKRFAGETSMCGHLLGYHKYKSVAMGNSPMRCTVCGKLFHTKNSLKTHQRMANHGPETNAENLLPQKRETEKVVQAQVSKLPANPKSTAARENCTSSHNVFLYI